MMMRNLDNVHIRRAATDDAQNMIDFYNVVGGESDYLSFGANEFKRDLQEYKDYITATSQEPNSIMLLATIDSKIIGIATINSSQKERTKHVGTLGIVISEKYTGMGLGKALMNELLEWAKQNGITKKISLVTNESNTKAIDLYRKLGFEQEGLLKKDNYIRGDYQNTIVMGLFL
ncbi:GNAT family acetyltransferase [Fictibacillus phosphorivorans]|uniref:GNAT family acetyltransferase n=1 Tax=Fictibacillus phosphorivorans TaxID=1221500 RepID=A0A161RTM1_9BACL|nr:GNAT family N-acetyltransferase [Fictibacillus phosphorivorans]KZE64846.1 GNAT family acetyltransferase [Fictibacillus phosphorivorans]